MPAGVIEARRDQPRHAQLAHVAERHRWAGGLLSLHSVSLHWKHNSSCGLEAQFELWASRVKTKDPTIAQSIGGAFLD
jgi:hypothetical protein